MNCDCLTEIKAKLLEYVTRPKYFKKPVKRLELSGITMLLQDNKFVTRTCSQVEVELEGQKKKETFPMVHSFCPYCGKSQGDKA
ncbi:hypothetical protein OYT1_ch1619 [Ferriphaselus amnicola]|uniref:Uncharacterized protein n=1 Tax=Ferriphaselus amnicola TaxID=1188319 RepID=A0A2Z6GCD9_9PROT|nr:hypothetical protein OYT1_ch1619 [Ferriphaselus amnicola]